MQLQPYFALDLETTDLVEHHTQILQLSMIYDDGKTSIDKLPKLDLLIKNEEPLQGNHYALALNHKILKTISQGKDKRIVDLSTAKYRLKRFINEITQNTLTRITIAGKNAANFDIPILENNGFETKRFKHRVLDVGPLYLTDFGYVPNLDEINSLIGRDKVSHNAIDDCTDVICAIRHKCGLL